MAEGDRDTSWVVPYPADTASKHKLRLWIDQSAVKAGWKKGFSNGYRTFNKLVAEHHINVEYELAADAVNCEVTAYAMAGGFEFDRDGVQKSYQAFDPFTFHGLTVTTYEVMTSRNVTTKTIKHCYIYVPNKAGMKENNMKRTIGEGPREVIAVHELIHAAGVGDDNRRHSDNDVFAWPQYKQGATAADDKIVVATGNKVLDPKIKREVWEKEEQPPIKMRGTTAQWLIDVWGVKPTP